MRKLLMIILGCVLHLSLSAQLYRSPEFFLGGSVGISYPMGKFSDVADKGYGANLVGRWLLNEQIAVGFEAGFSQFGKNEKFWAVNPEAKVDVKYQVIPALLAGTYIFKAWDRDFKPYVSVAFGYYLFRLRVDYTSPSTEPVPYNPDPSLEYNIKENKFGVAPSLGFMYYLSKQFAFDMNMRCAYVPNFPKFQAVRQKYTNVVEGVEKYIVEENYPLAFEKLSSISLNVGLLYRF